jgi:hypothetical protein
MTEKEIGDLQDRVKTQAELIDLLHRDINAKEKERLIERDCRRMAEAALATVTIKLDKIAEIFLKK